MKKHNHTQPKPQQKLNDILSVAMLIETREGAGEEGRCLDGDGGSLGVDASVTDVEDIRDEEADGEGPIGGWLIIASWSRLLTSSAVVRCKGVCPSYKENKIFQIFHKKWLLEERVQFERLI